MAIHRVIIPHADRHAGDESFTVCVSGCVFVCLSVCPKDIL